VRPPAETPERSRRRKLLYVTLPGCWGGLIFACLSFSPSLLPRGGLLQGLICGITAAIGYGLGVLAASAWRGFTDRSPRRPRPWAWRAFFISAPVLFAVSFGLGQYWQHDIRRLIGGDQVQLKSGMSVGAARKADLWDFCGGTRRPSPAHATGYSETWDPGFLGQIRD
jgi:uncharacterized membrane protein